MATAVGMGLDLSNLDKMISKLNANLQRFVDRSEDAQLRVIDAFMKMGTQGVDKFIGQLSSAINKVMEIGKKGDTLKWDSKNLERYVNQVNQLISLVQQVQGAGYILPTDNLNKEFASISRLKDDLKYVNELLNKGVKTGVDSNNNPIYRELTKDEQNWLVEYKKNLQEQLKSQNETIQQRLNAVRKGLQQELKEHQEAEKKKTQSRNQSYKGSIKYSDNAKTLEQERQAIENLKAAREKLKQTDADYAVKLEALNSRIDAHRINIEAATKSEAQRNALTSSTRAEYTRLRTEQEELRKSYDNLKKAQAVTGKTPENEAALRDIVKRYRDVYAEILRYKQSSNGQLDATERKFLADQANRFADNERRKTELAQEEARKRATISSADANKVIADNRDAKNINQSLAAIQRLKDARAHLDRTDANYEKTLKKLNEEIRRHQTEIDKAEGKQKQLANTASNLQQKLATVFSISAITGYAKKVVEVRGEFELQHRALQAIVQDVDEANKLWDKTVALAVKSPFKVKDLVTYTKQLAAYRIETDKLYDKTKMLADIASGLGVDMNRLILAYGQVKAANYLRGTELRQFSEAGINILGELSTYFTELEGRAVSVGDVFERVSKRMVSFEDVDAVLQRVTSEGGAFYQMQEKQSATLKGMTMNLKDSIDLMMNAIGEQNEGIMKGAVSLVKELVDSWRTLLPIIQTTGLALLAAFSPLMLSKVAAGFTKVGAAMKAAFATNPATAFLAVITAIISAVVIWRKRQSELNVELSKVESNITKSLGDSIVTYKKLVETVNDATASYDERNKALSTLKQKYQDILPDEMLELEYIKGLKGSYEDAEQAMMAYYDAKAKAQKKSVIQQQYDKELDVNTKELKGSLHRLIDMSNFDDVTTARLDASIDHIVNETVEKVKSGAVEIKHGTDLLDLIMERVKEFAGVDLGAAFGKERSEIGKTTNIGLARTATELMYLLEQTRDVTNNLNDLKKELEDVNGIKLGENWLADKRSEALASENEKIEQTANVFRRAATIYNDALNDIKKGDSVEDALSKANVRVGDLMEEEGEGLGKYADVLGESFDKMAENVKKGSFEFNAELQGIESLLFKHQTTLDTARESLESSEGFNGIPENGLDMSSMMPSFANDMMSNLFSVQDDFGDIGKTAADMIIDNYEEELVKRAEKLDYTPFQKASIEGISKIADRHKLDADVFAKYIPKQGDSRQTIATQIKADYDITMETIKQMETSLTQNMPNLSEDIIAVTQQRIKELKLEASGLVDVGKLFGIDVNEKKKKNENLTDERLRVIDQMNKKFNDLNKTLSRQESIEGAFEAYKDAFEKAFKGTSFLKGVNMKTMTAEEFSKTVLNFPDKDAIVGFLGDMSKEAKKAADKIKIDLKKGEYTEEMKVESRQEDQDKMLRQIEDMFGNYEVSLEMDKLNIPPDLAKRLFGVDAIDVSELRQGVLDKLNIQQQTGMSDEDYANLSKKSDEEILETVRKSGMATDMIDELEKYLEKAGEMEDKALKERMQEYVKYLRKEQNERINFKMDEIRKLKDIAEMQERGLISSVEATSMKSNIQKETEQNIEKSRWDDFTKSATYVNMFDDVTKSTTASLGYMKQRLEEMKQSMIAAGVPASDLKEIFKQIEVVEEELDNRNLFLGIGGDIKDVVTGFDEYLEARKQEKELLERKKNLETQLTGQEELSAIEQEQGGSGDADALANLHAQEALLALYEKGTDEYDKQLQKVNEARDALYPQTAIYNQLLKANQEVSGELEDVQGKTDKWQTKLTNAAEKFQQIGDAVISIGSSLNDTLVATGAMDEDTAAIVDNAMNVAGDVVGIGTNLAGVIANPASLQSWVGLLTSSISLIGNIAKTGDAARDKEIKKEAENLGKLQDKYEDLEKAMDKAYTLEDMSVTQKAMEQNLKAQKDAIEAQKAAEESKKNTDEDAVEDYDKQLKELQEKEEAMKQEFIESVGGSYDFAGVAEEFLDAWLTAFEETGDGLSGLDDAFDGFWKDVIKKQVVLGGASKIMEQYMTMLNQKLEDGKLDDQEIKALDDKEKETKEKLNEFYEWANSKYDLADTGDRGELSGLQAGIQGITEQQADVLASYWNSSRMSLSSLDEKANQIIASLNTINDTGTNSMYDHIKTTAQQTAKIYNLLETITANDHNKGGAGIKVFIE